MGATGDCVKSPRAPPPPRGPKPSALKNPHVHFQKPASSAASVSAHPLPDTDPKSNSVSSTTQTQPEPQSESFVPSTNFPQVGPAPGGSSGHNTSATAEAGGTWHTAADPTKSVGPLGPGAYQQSPFSPYAHQQFYSPATHPGAFPYTQGSHPSFHCFGLPNHHAAPSPNMSGDYSNTGPPPTGVNFQPPVPDTTYGPMNHTFMPRFDGGGFYPVIQVGAHPQTHSAGSPIYLVSPIPNSTGAAYAVPSAASCYCFDNGMYFLYASDPLRATRMICVKWPLIFPAVSESHFTYSLGFVISPLLIC